MAFRYGTLVLSMSHRLNYLTYISKLVLLFLNVVLTSIMVNGQSHWTATSSRQRSVSSRKTVEKSFLILRSIFLRTFLCPKFGIVLEHFASCVPLSNEDTFAAHDIDVGRELSQWLEYYCFT